MYISISVLLVDQVLLKVEENYCNIIEVTDSCQPLSKHIISIISKIAKKN